MGRRRSAATGVVIAVLATFSVQPPTAAEPNTTTRVSVSSSGEQGTNVRGTAASYNPAITPDGRFVAFNSLASNFVTPDANNTGAVDRYDVFVHDRSTGETELVSVSSRNGEVDPVQGNLESTNADISADGRYVSFSSAATNLLFPGADLNTVNDIYVHDRQTETTTRVSESSAGAEADGASGSPAISANGRYVTFQSAATNLVPGDTNAASDVFVHDLQSGNTTRVSVAGSAAAVPGAQGNGASLRPSISGDGRYVAFDSLAANLAGSDSNGAPDVFVHDRQTGATTRVSVASSGAQAIGGSSTEPALTPDGRYVSFRSAAFNLVPGDTNTVEDVFVHDRATATTVRVSVASDGAQGNGNSGTHFAGGGDETTPPAMSSDGRYVTFRSEASNLVSGDTNGFGDIFVHDRVNGATTRASVANNGAQANDQSGELGFDISGDGRFVAFDSKASNLVEGDTNANRDIFVREMALVNSIPVISIGDAAVSEGDGGTRSAVFTVSLSEPAGTTVTVAYATAKATAVGTDFTAKSGTLSLAPGTTSAAIKVSVAGDTADEGDESFTLALSSPVEAVLGDAAGTGTIFDDDPGTGRRLAIGDVSVHEGDSGVRTAVFTVSLSKAATSTVTVAYATANGTATKATGGDYTAKSGTVSFAAGATSATVKVAINPDTAPEVDETFTVTLSNSSGPTITRAAGTGTIVDDE